MFVIKNINNVVIPGEYFSSPDDAEAFLFAQYKEQKITQHYEYWRNNFMFTDLGPSLRYELKHIGSMNYWEARIYADNELIHTDTTQDTRLQCTVAAKAFIEGFKCGREFK